MSLVRIFEKHQPCFGHLVALDTLILPKPCFGHTIIA